MQHWEGLTFLGSRLVIRRRIAYCEYRSVSNQACPHHAGMMSVPPLRSPFGTDPLRSVSADSLHDLPRTRRVRQCAPGEATEARQLVMPAMIAAGADFTNTSGTRSTAARRGP